jgi:ketosteroid isomerase-like protein
MRIDPTRTWRKVEERLARERDPRRRRNLETVLAHMKAEAKGDLEGLMATVAEDARYHAYATPDPAFSPKGKAAVRKFYADYVASGAHRLEFEIDRLVVDDECVITEGVMRIAYPGSLLKMLGHPIDDPDAYYLYETRMCTLWPMTPEGLVRGEDTYNGGDGFEGIAGRKLRPEDLPSGPPAV